MANRGLVRPRGYNVAFDDAIPAECGKEFEDATLSRRWFSTGISRAAVAIKAFTLSKKEGNSMPSKVKLISAMVRESS